MARWSRLLTNDPARGKRVWVDFEADGSYCFRHEQSSVKDIIEDNKAYARENPKGAHIGNTQTVGVKIAEIPLVVWQQLKDEGVANDPKALRKWLRDYDNRFFRTYGGAV